MIYNSGTKIIQVGNINKISDQSGEVFQYFKAPEPHDYSKDYLTFEAIDNCTFSFSGESGNTVNYSIDGGTTWTNLPSTASTPTVNAGDKILFKATLTPYLDAELLETDGLLGVGRFSSTGRFNAMGNAYSLLDEDNFADITSLGFNYACAFYGMFLGCTGLTSAEHLALPAVSLAGYDYAYMFSGCTSLIAAPELPSPMVASYCYKGMFKGCTSLTTAPELISSNTIPECYYEMFMGCTSLVNVQSVLPATGMFRSCYEKMFRGCTSLTTAPELPAVQMSAYAPYCYNEMFYGCSNLTYIKALAYDEDGLGMAITCMNNWVNGVAASGTFVKNASMTTWPTGNYGIPSGWTVVDYNV